MIIKHIKENSFFYLGFILLFSVGISLGAYWVTNVSIETKELLIMYLNGFFNFAEGKIFNNSAIFKSSFINNIISILLLLIFGFTYVGIIFSPILTIFRGFCFGFSIAFLVESFGRKGLIFSLVSLLPHNIVLIPSTIFLCSVSLQYSLFLLKSRNEKRYENKRQSFINYIFSFILGMVLVVLSTVIESYITPVFIKSISSFIQ
ncbi:MAG: stage II sporulation protein M [Clostridiales bacterium]|mgnify:CR=1 FL=1|nr:stage II sporulation protein M [Clostridiales bacterium]